MTDRHPWFKFHTADWRGDLSLRQCSLAARGLWMECLAIMHESTPRGYLVVADAPVTVERLAISLSRPMKEVRAALAELEAYGVSSRTDEGVLFSRRMVRDTARREVLVENGKKGGNPALLDNQHVAVLVKQDSPSLVKSAQTMRVLASGISSSSPGLDLGLVPPPGESGDLAAARFATFWDAYPRKSKRKYASQVFTKLNPDAALFTRMLDAIAVQKLGRQWRQGVIPHASTWLNGEQWADEVLPDSGPVAGRFPARAEGPPPPPPASEVLKKMGLA